MTGVYDVRPPIARCVVSCVLPSLLFAVLSLQVRPRTIKPLSTFDFVHMRKKIPGSPPTPAQLQCSHSGAWESGNEASEYASP